MGFRVWGFRLWGVGFRFWSLGLGLGLGVLGSRDVGLGVGFRVSVILSGLVSPEPHAMESRLSPKAPCTYIVTTWALKGSVWSYFKA